MYKVRNEAWGEECESSNEYCLWHYIHHVLEDTAFTKLVQTSDTEWKIVRVQPTDEQEELIKHFDWCGRDWVRHQIWNGNDTKEKIWRVIRSLPEYYFG